MKHFFCKIVNNSHYLLHHQNGDCFWPYHILFSIKAIHCECWQSPRILTVSSIITSTYDKEKLISHVRAFQEFILLAYCFILCLAYSLTIETVTYPFWVMVLFYTISMTTFGLFLEKWHLDHTLPLISHSSWCLWFSLCVRLLLAPLLSLLL